jgi:hypothetical protein
MEQLVNEAEPNGDVYEISFPDAEAEAEFQLVEILAAMGEPIVDGGTVDQLPSQLTLRFSSGQRIDWGSLGGISVTRAGLDGQFGDDNDVAVASRFGWVAAANEVRLRFNGDFPDDLYQITILGSGAAALRNTSGDVFGGGMDEFVTFTVGTPPLDLGDFQLEQVATGTGELIQDGDNLAQGPTQLSLLFSGSQDIDPNTLDGIRVTRAGLDGQFGDANDVVINPTSTSMGMPYEVTLTFASSFPSDLYQITVFGSGATPLLNTAGEAFNEGMDEFVTFSVGTDELPATDFLLVEIQSDVSGPIVDGDTLVQGPSELTFLFSAGQDIDPNSLGGIVLTGAGQDGQFGDANDVVITPLTAALGATNDEVILVFAGALIDDLYQISILGTGPTPLQNTSNEPFAGGVDAFVTFTVDTPPPLVAPSLQFIEMRSNLGGPIQNDQIIDQSPTELTFLFGPGQEVDPASLVGPAAGPGDDGIQVVRAGFDGLFGTADDVLIAPGFVGLGDNPNDVIIRFTDTLPDDLYQVTLFGEGLNPLRDSSGNAFNDGVNVVRTFELDLGAQIVSVTPQPVIREQIINVLDVALLSDGDTFSVSINGTQVVFELEDSIIGDGVTAGNTQVDFTSGASSEIDVATAIADKINNSGLGVVATLAGSTITVTGDSFTATVSISTAYPFALPAGGLDILDASLISDGDTVSVTADGTQIVFELEDLNVGDGVAAGNTRVDFTSGVSDATAIAAAIAAEINLSGLGVLATPVGASITFNDLPFALTIGGLDIVDASLVSDGDIVSVTANGIQIDFELEDLNVGDGVTPGNTRVDFTSGVDDATAIAAAIAARINLSGLGVLATPVGAFITFTDDPFTATVSVSTVNPSANPFTATVSVSTADRSALESVAGGLVQRENQIVLHFNEDDLDPASAETRAFYQLIETNDTLISTDDMRKTPDSVFYDSVANTVTLTFDFIPDGTYRLRIGESDPRSTLTLTVGDGGDDNSSFATATTFSMAENDALGAGDLIVINSQIERQSIALPPLPGGLDEPGHREIPVEAHFGSVGTVPVVPGAIAQFRYNFQDVIGADPQGNTLFNLISEEEKIRAREIFEIYSERLGIEFIETPSSGLIVATGDVRAVDPALPVSIGGISGGGKVVMNAAQNFSQEYGGSWMGVALHEIGHAVGLGHSYDIPSVQGGGLTGEPIFTGDHDFVHLERILRPDATDIDLYEFDLAEDGLFTAEIFAERLTNVSLLNSALTIFDGNGNVLARNDDYFSNDAYLELQLAAGTYFVGVTSTGNLDYDPAVSDTGSGGTTDGNYELRFNFLADPEPGDFLMDVAGTAFDGAADGIVGGVFDFWFQSGETIFVDKANFASTTQDGSLANPYSEIDLALEAVTGTTDIVRIVGNGGGDGDLATPEDALTYQIGFDDNFATLEDGITLIVPQDVTVMIDEGAVIKLQNAIIEVGSASDLIDRSQAALQILGTPDNQVVLTSHGNDAIGGDTDGVSDGANPGDWGGVVFRADSDLEDDGIFLNYVNQANITFGGGQVLVDSVLDIYSSIHVIDARPTISFNTITQGADAAISATLGSFADTILDNRDATLSRIGLDVHGNTVTNNSVNGLFVAVETVFGNAIDKVDTSIRFDDTDIVHIVTENIQIVGNPGGPIEVGGVLQARQSGRLRIDAATVVKLSGARIEGERGHSNFIAEGTAEQQIIFTSIFDDRYGRGGTFDTTNDTDTSTATAGDWGGIVLNAVSNASIDNSFLAFGGGLVPIEGGFDNFNVIEVHQADLRLTNSRFDSNAAGRSVSNRTGRGRNDATTVFIRGAQPIIVGNVFVANSGSVASINANSMRSDVIRDLGRSTGFADAFTQFPSNRGPLVRLNQFEDNAINGMEVRAEELTIESVWDDTDIVHVLRGEITVPNFHTFGGLRLESSADSSLVVKLAGANAGFTATGFGLDIDDRIGGTVQIVGQPLHPVVLTSLNDDSVGAGLDLNDQPQNDTNGDGAPPATVPATASGSQDGHVHEGSHSHTDDALGDDNYGDDIYGDGTDVVVDTHMEHDSHPDDSMLSDPILFGESRTVYAPHHTDPGHPGTPTTHFFQETGDADHFAWLDQDFSTPSVIDINYDFRDLNGVTNVITAGQMIMAELALQAWENATLGAINFIRNTTAPRADVVIIGTGDLSALGGTSGLGGVLGLGGGTFNHNAVHTITNGSAWQDSAETWDEIFNNGNPTGTVDYFTIAAQEIGHAIGLGHTNDLAGPDLMDGSYIVIGEQTVASANDIAHIQVVYGVGSGGGTGAVARPGDWRSIRLQEFSNDRNIEVFNELEGPLLRDLTDDEQNAIINNAQFLGELAPNDQSGDENRRLGFEVHGFIAADDPGDVDIYSFDADAGTQVWFDIDRTDPTLNAIIELLDPLGNILAQSINNTTFSGSSTVSAASLIEDSRLGGDFYTANPNDPGMRLILPGVEDQSTTYYVRVRSNSTDLNNEEGGLTSGHYQLQIRVNQVDEQPGSTIQYADIRFATNGIEILGLPGHSPLVGEAGEAGDASDTLNQAQQIGNLLTSDRNTISLAGRLSGPNDIDFYQFTLDYDLIQVIGGFSDGSKTWATIFDIDYADGLARPDTTLSVFDANGNLILVSRGSDITDDRARPTEGADFTDDLRGSLGMLDPFIGSQQMPAGSPGGTTTYFVAISSDAQLPTALNATFVGNAANPLIRLEPVNSVQRIVEDHIGFDGYTSGRVGFGMTVPVLPTTTTIIDITNTITLSTHISNFSLSDVVLFVATSSGSFLETFNPFTGDSVTSVSVTPTSLAGNNGLGDIAFRQDGELFGQTTFGNAAASGQFLQIDTGTGTGTSIGDDGLATNPNVGGEWDALTFYRRNNTTFEGIAANNQDADDDNNPDTPNAPPLTSVPGLPRGVWRLDPNGVTRDESGAAGRQRLGDLPSVATDVTGLAFDAYQSNTLFAVDDAGSLYRTFFSQGGGTNGASIGFGLGNPWTLVRADVTGTGAGFTGLTLGPQNLDENLDGIGDLASTFFATADNGSLYAFDSNGDLQSVFAGGATSVSLGGFFGFNTTTTGLAFSPLDFNLWHPTLNRNDDAGHGINETFDESRVGNTGALLGINGRSSNENEGGASLYFGLEQHTIRPTTDNVYLIYQSGTGQLGVLNSTIQRDLTSNPNIGDNYNLAGGAFGSLETNSFSLLGYSRTDQPTLYFNYYLETEGAIGSFTDTTMFDSARVFISANDGATWSLVTTNNSLLSTIDTAELPQFVSSTFNASFDPQQRVQELFDNTNGWRQARVDLGQFAGQDNLTLRFDFATAGVLNDPTLPFEAERFGSTSFNLTGRGSGQNNNFEGFYIDDIIVGFAERGEMVTGSTTAPTFFAIPENPAPDAPEQVLQGPYQLEIRRGEEYGETAVDGLGHIYITQQFDTNDRLATGVTLTASAGSAIFDGDVFTIFDGVHTIEFEFNNSGGVQAGRIDVSFNAGDSDFIIANKMAAAINTTNSVLPGLVPDFAVRATSVFTSNLVELSDAINAGATTTPLNLTVSLDATTISEVGGTTTITVTREDDDGDIFNNLALSFTFTAIDPSTGGSSDEVTFVAVPFEIPAGMASATFTIDAIDDLIADGIQSVLIQAAAAGFSSVTDMLDVTDNQVPALMVTITGPTAVFEGGPLPGDFIGSFVTAGSGGLDSPLGLVIGPNNNFYVSGQFTANVLRFDGTTGAFIDEFVSAGNGGLDTPVGLLFDAAGNLYVSSENTDSVLRYDSTGNFIDVFVTTGSGGLNSPRRMVFGPDGRLYVTSANNDSVLRYDETNGAFIDAFVTTGDGGLDGPLDVVFGPDNNLYVSSVFTDSVLRYDGTTGAFIDDFVPASSGGLLGPSGLVFGSDGNLYVSSQFTDNILRYDGNTGAFIDEFVSSGAGGLDQPLGLVFDAAGSLYVNSQLTDEVLRFVGPSIGATQGTVTRNTPTNSDLVVSLVSLDTSEVIVPPTVTILAGDTLANFPINPVQDFIIDGDQTAAIVAYASGFSSDSTTIDVLDSSVEAGLTLTIAAPSILESAGAAATTATVTRNNSTAADLVVNLISHDLSEAAVPTTVTILAGQTSVTFDIDAVDDVFIDGLQTVNFTAFASGFRSSSDTLDVLDDVADTIPLGVVVWTEQGPAPVRNAQLSVAPDDEAGGAIQTVVAHPTDPDILYIGAVNGGVWRTNNATDSNPTWTPLTDDLTSLSIGALEFDLTDATRQTLIAGIGRQSAFAGRGDDLTGLLLSTDGGNTWTEINNANLLGENFTSVAARGSTLLAASDSTFSDGGGGSGLFRSTDGGATFQLVSGSGSGLPAGQISDLVGDPNVLTRFYAAVIGVGVFRSDDSGASWTDVTAGITGIGASTDKIEMAVHNNGVTNAVYVAVINSASLTGLFRSTEQGANWTALDVPATGGQGFVHFGIAADAVAENFVYVRGQAPGMFRVDASLTSGNQITTLTGGVSGTPHVDTREITLDANNDLIDVNDGGIYRRLSPSSPTGVWESVIGNLGVMELHDVAYDSVSNIIIAGTQDNGTQIQMSTGNLVWDHIFGGDGGDVLVDDVSLAGSGQSIRYFSFQNLGGFRSQVFDAANNPVGGSTVIDTSVVTDAQFKTPLELNAIDPQRFVIGGSSNVYESLDMGATITNISAGVAGTNRPGALAYGGRRLSVDNPDVVYTGDGSQVFLRTTAGGVFTATSALPVGVDMIRDIELDPDDWFTAYVVDSNQVFVTADAGASWTDVTGNMAGLNNDLRTVLYVSNAGGVDSVFAGGRSGVFQMLTTNPGVWTRYGIGLPDVLAFELDYDVADDVLVAGTLGRGAWTTSGLGVAGGSTLRVTIAASSIIEDDGLAATTATITRSDTTGDLTVTITSSDDSEVTLNGTGMASITVVLLGGVDTVVIDLDAVDDLDVDGPQTVIITATAATGFDSITDSLDVLDSALDIDPTLTITILAPDIVLETDGLAATIARLTRSDTIGDLEVTLFSNDTTEATVIAVVIIPDGVSSIDVAINAIDDLFLDGTQTVIISAQTPVAFVSGPIFLDGGDRDDHGSFDGTNNLAGWLFIEQGLDFVYSNSFNTSATDILVIGATAGNALDAVSSAASVLGLPAPVVITGSAISTVDFSNFRVVYIPSSVGGIPSGITQSDLDLLNARRDDIQTYINETGGGLMALTETEATDPYGYLELPDPFTIIDFAGGGNPASLMQTPLLAAAGFNIADVDLNFGVPWHNSFVGPPDFNGLEVWVISTNNDVVTLGLPPGSGGVGVGLTRPYFVIVDTLDVDDNETFDLTVVLDQSSISEAAGLGAVTGTVFISGPLTTDLLVTLTSSDESEVTVPMPVVTILAGSTSATFSLDAVNELADDGTRTVTVFATAPRFSQGRDSLDVLADSSTAVSFNRLGDSNLDREQGLLLIQGNSISNALIAGIVVDAGARDPGSSLSHPGAARNLPTLNSQALAYSTVIENNIVFNFGQSGIVFSGDTNTGNVSNAIVPFGRIVNNTIYGGETATGVGIRVNDNASPTILNNIVANTDTGISVSANSSTTVVGTTVFQDNGTNTTGVSATNSIILSVGDPLFVNPLGGNFYLSAGSRAIDSSLNRLEDRPAITLVTDRLGIDPSDIFSPERDIFGQLRVDDPSQAPPPGLGFRVFTDRGAVERADFVGPTAELIVPLDNGPEDLDADVTEVFILAPLTVGDFTLLLSDVGIGLDKLNIRSSQFELRRGGSLLVDGIDYVFGFNANTSEVTFSSISSSFELDVYTITVDNSAATGVRDLAGNAIRPNRIDGSTRFTITLGPELSIDDVTVVEGDTGTTEAIFTVTLSALPDSTITVDVVTSDGTATVGDNDFTPLTTTVTFNPGDPLTQTVTVLVTGDTIPELDETFFVNLTNVSPNARIAVGQGLGTIINDDIPSFSVNDISIVEGDTGTTTGTFEVTLSGPPTETVTVAVLTVAGTATEGVDYVALPLQILTFNPGDPLVQTVDVTVIGDFNPEPDETFFLELRNAGPAGKAEIGDFRGTATIIDDEPFFTIDDVTIDPEGDSGTTAATFTVTLSKASATDVTVEVFSDDGTATLLDNDYQQLPLTTLTFTPLGSLMQTVIVLVNGDTVDEFDETFSVKLQTVSPNATIRDAEGIGTIVNDDDPSITINDIRIDPEGDTGVTTATFTVSLSVVTNETVTVDISTADGTATAGSDYVSLPPLSQVTFAAGEDTQTFTVDIITDLIQEDTEEDFFVNLSNATNATIDDDQGKATIVDDDAPDVRINDVSILEGDDGVSTFAVFTVVLLDAGDRGVSIEYATADGTATAGSDYTATSGTLIFSVGGQLSQQILVPIIGDSIIEPDETFFLNLFNAVNANLLDSQGEAVIRNDDPVPPVTAPATAPSSFESIASTTADSNSTATSTSLMLSDEEELAQQTLDSSTGDSIGTSDEGAVTSSSDTVDTSLNDFAEPAVIENDDSANDDFTSDDLFAAFSQDTLEELLLGF